MLAHGPSLLGLLTSLSQEDNRSSGLYHVSKPPSGRVATRRQSPPSSHSGQVLAVSGVGLARQMVERRGPGRVLQIPGGGGVTRAAPPGRSTTSDTNRLVRGGHFTLFERLSLLERTATPCRAARPVPPPLGDQYHLPAWERPTRPSKRRLHSADAGSQPAAAQKAHSRQLRPGLEPDSTSANKDGAKSRTA